MKRMVFSSEKLEAQLALWSLPYLKLGSVASVTLCGLNLTMRSLLTGATEDNFFFVAYRVASLCVERQQHSNTCISGRNEKSEGLWHEMYEGGYSMFRTSRTRSSSHLPRTRRGGHAPEIADLVITPCTYLLSKYTELTSQSILSHYTIQYN